MTISQSRIESGRTARDGVPEEAQDEAQDEAGASLADIGFVLHDLGRLMRRRFEQRATPLGFTRSQWLVLLHLAKVEGIHQAGLAEILEMEPITLVRILDRLEARGLIERRQHPTDRRQWLLFLDGKAQQSLQPLQDVVALTRTEALATLSAGDRKELRRMLDVIKANLAEACARPNARKKAV